MGCNCGGRKTKYEVTKGDGTTVVVNTLSEAQSVVSRVGGDYKAVTV